MPKSQMEQVLNKDTASQVAVREDIRARHMNNVAVQLLLNSNVLTVERNLTDLLINIDKEHQEKIQKLETERDRLLAVARGF